MDHYKHIINLTKFFMVSLPPKLLALQLHQQAIMYINNRDWESAIKAGEQALKLYPDLAIACKTLGIAWQCKGELTEAEKWYKQALTIKPNFAEVYSNLGSLYAKQSQWQPAITAYKTALKINPNLAGAYRNLAKVWTELEDTDNFMKCQYKALQLEPEKGSADDYIKLGNLFLKCRQFTKAIACYRQAIKLYPDTSEAYHNLGEVLKALKRPKQAILSYQKALKVNPQSTMTYRSLEKILIEHHQWDELIKVYYQHLTVDYNCFETYRNLGKILLQKGQIQDAMNAFLKAIEIKPDFSWSYWNLWNILAEYEQLDQAREILVAAIDRFSDSEQVKLNLGELLSHQNKFPEAMVAYRDAAAQKMRRSHPEIMAKSGDKSSPIPPNFIIIGAQKGGTTSLYRYLEEHPQMVGCIKKETHFWTQHFDRGLDWYLSHFPQSISEANIITGEATPNYLEYPQVPERIFAAFPDIKLIVLLRNPITRAISQYHHWVRLMREYRPLETVMESELNLITSNLESESKLIQYPGYLWRGLYLPFLEKWMSIFPREQFLIIRSEDFYQNPSQVFNQVLDFLGLPSYELSNYCSYNSGRYPQIEPSVYSQLRDYFYPHNQRLQDFLNLEFDWD
ncbi:tetratricopeptide repeat-containing sulfotransferase family protein [Limnospira platensis]|uniref:tetratricopeptide repeat protein n=1 Tax=Limnospira platensis TaxID=118562 RepID=UPI0012DC9E8C